MDRCRRAGVSAVKLPAGSRVGAGSASTKGAMNHVPEKNLPSGNAKNERPIDFHGEFWMGAALPQQLVAERDDLPVVLDPNFTLVIAAQVRPGSAVSSSAVLAHVGGATDTAPADSRRQP